MSTPEEKTFLELLKQEVEKAKLKAITQGTIKPESRKELEEEYRRLSDQYKLAKENPTQYLNDLKAKQEAAEMAKARKEATTTRYFDTTKTRRPLVDLGTVLPPLKSDKKDHRP